MAEGAVTFHSKALITITPIFSEYTTTSSFFFGRNKQLDLDGLNHLEPVFS